MRTPKEAIREVDAPTLKSWLERGEAILVDVREPAEHDGERIPGAELRPLSSLEASNMPTEEGRRLVLHCASGNRSKRAAERLVSEPGCELEVFSLRGGIAAWKKAGLATEKSANAPISLERQVRIAAGSLVAVGTLLGAIVHPWFLVIPAFVGAGLVFAGVTDTCGMAMVLARLPYNQRGAACS